MSPRRRLFSVPAPPGVLRNPGWKPSGFASLLGLPLHKYLRAPAKCSPPPTRGQSRTGHSSRVPAFRGSPPTCPAPSDHRIGGLPVTCTHHFLLLIQPTLRLLSRARLCTRPRSHKKQTRHSPSHEDTSLHCAQKPRRNALWAPGCSPAPRPAPSDSTAASYRQLFKLKLSHVKSNGKISLLRGTRHSFQG